MTHEPIFKILIVMIGMILILLTCTSCGSGWTNNAKQIRIQIPALLDIEFEYNDEKGVSDSPGIKEIFGPSKE